MIFNDNKSFKYEERGDFGKYKFVLWNVCNKTFKIKKEAIRNETKGHNKN